MRTPHPRPLSRKGRGELCRFRSLTLSARRLRRLCLIRGGMGDDLFRCARCDHVTAAVAGFRAHVDEPVGRLDYVEIVLDHDDAVPQVDQAMQHLEQLRQVVEVQAGRRLVEEVKRAAGVGAR